MGASSSSALGRHSTAFDVVHHYAALAGVEPAALLAGRRAVVTGGNSGIGTETVKALAFAGAVVVFGSRSLSAGATALATEIAGPGPFLRSGDYALSAAAAARVSVLALDLERLESVRAFAEEVLRGGTVNILVCNAGVFGLPVCELTPHLFERQLGCNHLGHHYLISLLRGAMVASDLPSRIVIVSSKGHQFGSIDVADLHFQRGRAYTPFRAYGQSKTANILEAKELADQLAATKVCAVSLHPGEVTTNALRHVGSVTGAVLRFFNDKTIMQGAATTLFACLEPDTPALRGAYLDDCAIAAPTAEASDEGKVLRKALFVETESQIADALAALAERKKAAAEADVGN